MSQPQSQSQSRPRPTITITIRRATESDTPAILSLLLTSFRQFPLFSLLYAPLDADKATARDTVFFWRRRLLLDLLSESTEIVVAEVPRDQGPGEGGPAPVTGDRGGAGLERERERERESGGESGRQLLEREHQPDEIEAESWRMLDWCIAQGTLSQVSAQDPGAKVVVGFAIWEFRKGEEATGSLEFDAPRTLSWLDRLRASLVSYEQSLWKKIYTRKDQDHDRYAAYLAAEEELGSRFYAEHCYYLDNLCVDFRCHRLGIGRRLVEWGIERARSNKLAIQTEASPKGLGLYLKLGFKQIGTWTVRIPRYELEVLEMPVMRLETTLRP